jgi:hypothetical protein
MFVSNARSLHFSGIPERSLLWVGSGFIQKHYKMFERPAMNKHFTLFDPFIIYEEKILM